ncbi:MAG: hypothetical protein ACOC1P_02805 [Minisyncoccales bacterium]
MEEEIEIKFGLKNTTKQEGIEIINFLMGYHDITGNDIDLEE